MRRNRIAAAALTALLHCGTAHAEDGSLKNEGHRPDPGLAIASALLNVLFLPIRLPLTIIGAEFAGLSGFLSAGDEHVANDVFGLVDGTQIITPKVLKGHEPFRVSRY
jgi:hypothetical protein